jgi:hypothetical protein
MMPSMARCQEASHESESTLGNSNTTASQKISANPMSLAEVGFIHPDLSIPLKDHS